MGWRYITKFRGCYLHCKSFPMALTDNPGTKMYWKIEIHSQIRIDLCFTLIMKTHNMRTFPFWQVFCYGRKISDPKYFGKIFIRTDGHSSFHAEEHKDLVDFINTFNDDKYGRDPDFLNGIWSHKVESWDVTSPSHWSRKTSVLGIRFKEYFYRSWFGKIIYKLNRMKIPHSWNLKTNSLMHQQISRPLHSLHWNRILLSTAITIRAYPRVTIIPYVGFWWSIPKLFERPEIFTDPTTASKSFGVTLTPGLINWFWAGLPKIIQKIASDMISGCSPLKEEFNKDLKAITPHLRCWGRKKLLLTEGGRNYTSNREMGATWTKLFQGKNTSGSQSNWFYQRVYLPASDWKERWHTLLAQEIREISVLKSVWYLLVDTQIV